MSDQSPLVEPVQQTYARMLGVLVSVGFVFLFLGFIAYVTGALPSLVPVDEIPELWHLSADELARQTGRELGWAWVREITRGDLAAFASLVYFPSAALVLVAIAAGLYLRHRVGIYALIAFLEAVVLFVAATGVLSAGS